MLLQSNPCQLPHSNRFLLNTCRPLPWPWFLFKSWKGEGKTSRTIEENASRDWNVLRLRRWIALIESDREREKNKVNITANVMFSWERGEKTWREIDECSTEFQQKRLPIVHSKGRINFRDSFLALLLLLLVFFHIRTHIKCMQKGGKKVDIISIKESARRDERTKKTRALKNICSRRWRRQRGEVRWRPIFFRCVRAYVCFFFPSISIYKANKSHDNRVFSFRSFVLSLFLNRVFSLALFLRRLAITGQISFVRWIENIGLTDLSLQHEPPVECSNVNKSCVAFQMKIRTDVFVQSKGFLIGAMLISIDNQWEEITIHEVKLLGCYQLFDGIGIEFNGLISYQTGG